MVTHGYSIHKLSNNPGLSSKVVIFLLELVFNCILKESVLYLSLFLIPLIIDKSLTLANCCLFEINLQELLVAYQVSV